jgi:type II secretory pathway pseudopilin PulG
MATILKAARGSRGGRSAFSLLELMIAIGVLGIGLIMVSAIFPVALTQHRDSIERATALQLVEKAEAVLRSKIDSSRLWVEPVAVPPNTPRGNGIGILRANTDSPWYVLPSYNLAHNTTLPAAPWDYMEFSYPAPVGQQAYADAVSGILSIMAAPSNLGNVDRSNILSAMDVLSDRIGRFSVDINSPFTQAEFDEASTRYAWTGFYRKLVNGSTIYAAAICKQTRNQRFARQKFPSIIPAQGYTTPLGDPKLVRLPVPWRVSVNRDATGNFPQRLTCGANAEGLGELAPPGSKIMVQGAIWQIPSALGPAITLPIVPAGRILTVASVLDLTNDNKYNPGTIEVVEDISDLPLRETVNGVQQFFRFDVLVFPPEVIGISGTDTIFGTESPLVQWKVFL